MEEAILEHGSHVEEDYLERRGSWQSEYEGAYGEWIASLSAEERENLELLGIAEPDTDCPQINGKTRSAEDLDSVINITALKQGRHPDIPSGEEESKSVEDSHNTAAALRTVIVDLLGAKNLKLHLDAWASALGLEDATCAELGNRNGCTRQRFAYVRGQIVDQFGLRLPNCRSREIRAEHRERVSDKNDKWRSFYASVKSLAGWIHRRRDEESPSEWPAAHRELILRQCRPVVELCQELQEIEEKRSRKTG